MNELDTLLYPYVTRIAQLEKDLAKKESEYQGAIALIWTIAMQNDGYMEVDGVWLMQSLDPSNVLKTWDNAHEGTFCLMAPKPKEDGTSVTEKPRLTQEKWCDCEAQTPESWIEITGTDDEGNWRNQCECGLHRKGHARCNICGGLTATW